MNKRLSRCKVSKSCRGETCSVCDEQATHKVVEEDTSEPEVGEDGTFVVPPPRLWASNYVCCECFTNIMKYGAPCFPKENKGHE